MSSSVPPPLERGRSETPRRARSASGTRRPSSRQPSRESSVSSEVRCGCQFFQSDSLLPERVNPVGRPSSRASNKAVLATMASSTSQHQSIGDHEYEPISAPPPRLHVTDVDMELGMDEEFDAIKPHQVKSETSSTSSRERRFLRIPLEDDLAVVIHGDGEDEDEAMSGRGEWEGGGPGALDGPAEPGPSDVLQKQEQDDRYFANTPTTEASCTDRDVNTSQLDSSGLEEVPLKRENRKKGANGEASTSAATPGFQQRLRSQAGRIRTKLRNIKRPTFNMPERPKFNLPERPKFNLPERPKFHMPERPKFNLPERPKFHMPERPKFNFPDRSKFRLPERPKINLPERPKFNFPDRPKFNMTNLGNRIKEGRKKISSSVRRPLREKSQNVSSAASTSSSPRKNIFDFKTYPRIFDRKTKPSSDYATSSPKATRGMTPPPPARRKGPVGSRWMRRFGDMKYADSESQRTGASEEVDDSRKTEDMEMESGRGEDIDGRSESTSAFQDKDYGYAVTEALQPPEHIPLARQPSTTSSAQESDREQRSSGSSSDRRRAGVLEEIDSDEFFLREKGLSQEDVEVGRYLTSEIRDAFRAPSSQLDMEFYDEDIEDAENLAQQYRGTPERTPIRPARTRTLRKRSSKSKESTPAEGESETKFSTFPPTRPRRSRSRQSRNESEANQEEEEEDQKYDEDYLKPEMSGFEEEFRQEFMDRSGEEIRWQENEDLPAVPAEPPMPPKRARRGRREVIEPDTLCNGHYTKEDWMENVHAEIEPMQEVTALRMEPDYIIPSAPLGEEEEEEFDMPPEPPRRGRRASRGTASLADEDRTSRGAESIASERDQVEFETVDLPDTMAGYAFIDKPSTKPRRPKPPRPAAPNRRKKNGTLSHFFSLPLRGKPVRPLRNYSTLGPSRPPRKLKREVLQEYMEPEKRSEAYIEIEDKTEASPLTSQTEESQESTRDLQAGDIVEKMKGRPLPPPPRPPRKGREGKDDLELEGAQELKQGDEEGVEEPLFDIVKEEPLGALSDSVFYSRQRRTPSVTKEEVKVKTEEELDMEIMEEERRAAMEEYRESSLPLDEEEQEEYVVEEISRATQTDPLPEGVDVVVAEDAGTDTIDLEKARAPKLSDMGQQTSIPESYMPHPPSAVPVSTPISTPAQPSQPSEPKVIEKPIPYYVMPDPDTEIELKASKLQVSELDVERLTVGELQANKILVSDIDGVSMQVAELTSRSGNIVLSGLELPPGFLQELVESLPISQFSPPQYYPPPSQPQYSIPTQLQQPVSSTLSSASAPAAPEASSPPTSLTATVRTSEPKQKTEAKETDVPKSAVPLESCCMEELRQAPEESPKIDLKSEVVSDGNEPEKTETESSIKSEVIATDEAASPAKSEETTSVDHKPAPAHRIESAPSTKTDSSAPVKESLEAAAKSTSQREELPKIQSIPIHSIPMHSVGLEQLHSFEFIPSAFPVSVRVPSRQRRAELESDEEVIGLMQPQHSPPRRRRHHKPAVPQYSSDEEGEEEGAAVVRPASKRQHSSSREPSSAELTVQLIQACQGLTLRAIQQILHYAGSHLRGDADDKRRDLQMVLCILLIFVAGLILMGYGSGKTYHTHHWDYHFPPR